MNVRLWKGQTKARYNRYRYFYDKIASKYDLDQEYEFAGVSLTFLQEGNPAEQENNKEQRRLLLFFQNLVSYWQISQENVKTIANSYLLLRQMKWNLQFLYYQSVQKQERLFPKEFALYRELAEGRKLTREQIYESAVFLELAEGREGAAFRELTRLKTERQDTARINWEEKNRRTVARKNGAGKILSVQKVRRTLRTERILKETEQLLKKLEQSSSGSRAAEAVTARRKPETEGEGQGGGSDLVENRELLLELRRITEIREEESRREEIHRLLSEYRRMEELREEERGKEELRRGQQEQPEVSAEQAKAVTEREKVRKELEAHINERIVRYQEEVIRENDDAGKVERTGRTSPEELSRELLSEIREELTYRTENAGEGKMRKAESAAARRESAAGSEGQESGSSPVENRELLLELRRITEIREEESRREEIRRLLSDYERMTELREEERGREEPRRGQQEQPEVSAEQAKAVIEREEVRKELEAHINERIVRYQEEALRENDDAGKVERTGRTSLEELSRALLSEIREELTYRTENAREEKMQKAESAAARRESAAGSEGQESGSGLVENREVPVAGSEGQESGRQESGSGLVENRELLLELRRIAEIREEESRREEIRRLLSDYERVTELREEERGKEELRRGQREQSKVSAEQAKAVAEREEARKELEAHINERIVRYQEEALRENDDAGKVEGMGRTSPEELSRALLSEIREELTYRTENAGEEKMRKAESAAARRESAAGSEGQRSGSGLVENRKVLLELRRITEIREEESRREEIHRLLSDYERMTELREEERGKEELEVHINERIVRYQEEVLRENDDAGSVKGTGQTSTEKLSWELLSEIREELTYRIENAREGKMRKAEGAAARRESVAGSEGQESGSEGQGSGSGLVENRKVLLEFRRIAEIREEASRREEIHRLLSDYERMTEQSSETGRLIQDMENRINERIVRYQKETIREDGGMTKYQGWHRNLSVPGAGSYRPFRPAGRLEALQSYGRKRQTDETVGGMTESRAEYRPAKKEYRRSVLAAREGTERIVDAEETELRVFRREVTHTERLLKEQQKKIETLQREWKQQKNEVKETLVEVRSQIKPEQTEVQQITDRIMKEMQKQFQLEKMRRGF